MGLRRVWGFIGLLGDIRGGRNILLARISGSTAGSSCPAGPLRIISKTMGLWPCFITPYYFYQALIC